MTYQAPYAARYVSAAGNQIQLLNLWDDTPEPPRFGGSMEAFETSLVDGPRAFAQGLGSAVEQRTIAFYRWFVDYQDMATWQENMALWLASNQNGYLYLQFAEQPQWRFAAVITGYQFETENFVPPPSPEDGYLCLLVTLTMTVTDRTPDNSNWVFSVTPASFDVPVQGGEYTVNVESSFTPGPVGQGWQIANVSEGLTVSDVVNGNNGSFKVAVSANEGDEDRTMSLQVIQDGTGQAVEVEFRQPLPTFSFGLSPTELQVPITGGDYSVNVSSFYSPGEVSVDWTASSPSSSVVISDVVNGNNGSFKVAVSDNEGAAATVRITATQQDSGEKAYLRVLRAGLVTRNYTLPPPQGEYTDVPMGYSSWRFIPSDVYPDFPEGNPEGKGITLQEIVTTNPTSSNSGTLSLYRVENGTASLLATSNEAVSTGEGGNVKWTFSPGVEIRSDWQLVVENQNGIYEKNAMLNNPQSFDGLGNDAYPASATAPGRTFSLSLVIRYTSIDYPS